VPTELQFPPATSLAATANSGGVAPENVSRSYGESGGAAAVLTALAIACFYALARAERRLAPWATAPRRGTR